SVERRDLAVWTAEKAVGSSVRIYIFSRDYPKVVDVFGAGAPHDGVRAGNVEISELTIGSAHEAVSAVVVIRDVSRDCAKPIDTKGLCALSRARARVWRVERDDLLCISLNGHRECG